MDQPLLSDQRIHSFLAKRSKNNMIDADILETNDLFKMLAKSFGITVYDIAKYFGYQVTSPVKKDS